MEGTWYVPPVFKNADDFCAFWEEAPLPEEALARFHKAYDPQMYADRPEPAGAGSVAEGHCPSRGSSDLTPGP